MFATEEVEVLEVLLASVEIFAQKVRAASCAAWRRRRCSVFFFSVVIIGERYGVHRFLTPEALWACAVKDLPQAWSLYCCSTWQRA